MNRKIILLFCLSISSLLVVTATILWSPRTGPGTDSVEAAALLKPNRLLDHLDLLSKLLFSVSTLSEAQIILDKINASKDTRFMAGLIDILRYRPELREEIGYTLNKLTGQNLGSEWGEWVEWAGKHAGIESFSAYPTWKARIFEKIDPDFRRFVHADMAIAQDSRVEEIVWGGVRVDGIPSLDNPKMIEPHDADYLVPDERIFGVSINGDTRAYPARFLDWHEMFNDVIGGQPVTLAY